MSTKEKAKGLITMGRYIGPKCKLCRREGTQLYLKGDRCLTNKCNLEKPPGMHSWRKPKLSEYGKRLREKQKLKRHYGLFEKQFKSYFKKASRMPGNSGENFIVLLESRLDNIVYRGGIAHSRNHARQMIRHGHITINDKKVDIPSYLLKEGDIISHAVKESSKKIVEKVKESPKRPAPSWLECTEDLKVKVVNKPVRDEVQLDVQDQYIVEFFSR